MSTPSLDNSDNIGNYYWGWRTDLFDFSSSQISPNADSTILPWINTSLGSGTLVSNGSNRSLILPSSLEILSRPAVASSSPSVRKGRIFDTEVWTGNANTASNGSGGTIFLVSPTANQFWTPADTLGAPGWASYYVINTNSIAAFHCAFLGNNLNPASGYRFFYLGWLKNPLYTGVEAPRGFVYCILSNTSSLITGARPSSVVGPNRASLAIPSSASADSIANYSITCQTSTPGANTTDLVFRDSGSPNRAIGVAFNLLKTSLAIPVGQIYRNTGVDPDGSNNQFWICVGVYGSERILMRVWTQNLT